MAFASKYTGAQIEALLDKVNTGSFDALNNLYSSRPTSADVLKGDSKLRYFLATKAMTTSKPGADSHILHMAWDNASKWDSELALHSGVSPHMQIRSMNGSTWGGWKYILDETNFNSYAPKLDGTGASGKWDIQADLKKYSHGSNGTHNYPWHLIASATSSSSYSDFDALIVIKPYFNESSWGIAKISVRTNTQTSVANGTGSFRWLATNDIIPGDYCICTHRDDSTHTTTCHFFMKKGDYARTEVFVLSNRGFTFYDSYDKNDVSQNTNCWADLSAAREALIPGSTEYFGVSDSEIVGRVKYADQLKTARTIWGSSFNGTNDINNNITVNRNVTSAVKVTVTNSNGSVSLGTTTNRGIYDETKTKWIIATNGTATWLDDGNVGIGTTSPSAKLHVNGSLKAGTTNVGTLTANTLDTTGDATIEGNLSCEGSVTSDVGFSTTGYVSVMSSNYNAANA